MPENKYIYKNNNVKRQLPNKMLKENISNNDEQKRMNKVVFVFVIILIIIVNFIVLYFSLNSDNDDSLYSDFDNSYNSANGTSKSENVVIIVFKSPFELSDDDSGEERLDEDGVSTYFKPGRNRILKNYEFINNESIRSDGWAIWGLEVGPLREQIKYKLVVTMAIDSIPENGETVVAKINTNQVGILGGHHVCITPNSNTLDIKASDFDNANEFKEISMEFYYKKFTVDDMEHIHKGKGWNDFDGHYNDGMIELRIGWLNRRTTGLKVSEIRLERVVEP